MNPKVFIIFSPLEAPKSKMTPLVEPNIDMLSHSNKQSTVLNVPQCLHFSENKENVF